MGVWNNSRKIRKNIKSGALETPLYMLTTPLGSHKEWGVIVSHQRTYHIHIEIMKIVRNKMSITSRCQSNYVKDKPVDISIYWVILV